MAPAKTGTPRHGRQRRVWSHDTSRRVVDWRAGMQAANLTCANHIPVQRAARLMSQLAGVTVSAG